MITFFHTGNYIVDVIFTLMFLVLITYPIIGGFSWFIGVFLLYFFVQVSSKGLARDSLRN